MKAVKGNVFAVEIKGKVNTTNRSRDQEFCTPVNLATLSEWLRLSTTHCWTSSLRMGLPPCKSCECVGGNF
jgi:hypothetical protein